MPVLLLESTKFEMRDMAKILRTCLKAIVALLVPKECGNKIICLTGKTKLVFLLTLSQYQLLNGKRLDCLERIVLDSQYQIWEVARRRKNHYEFLNHEDFRKDSKWRQELHSGM